jgi:hypothetical protein
VATSDRPIVETGAERRCDRMSAQVFVEHDLFGAFPALWLLLVLVLTALGVVAHASFA